jgi:hypothetical protein
MTKDQEPNPLVTLVESHQTTAVDATIYPGRYRDFNPWHDITDPERLLIVFRKSYGTNTEGPILGEEYLVAQPTHTTDVEGKVFRAGSFVALDFLGNPGEVAKVEGFLYRQLLLHDQAGREIVAKHMAIFRDLK